MSREEVSKLPTVEQSKMQEGKRDGEVRLFKNGQNAEAFVWKAAEKVWEKMGDVISEIPKKFYEGDNYFAAGDYDHVFEVEDDSGITKQIPFNEGDNMMEAADKYCAREGLGKGYVDQIRQFLRQNTKTGQNSMPSKAHQSRGIYMGED
jgi:phospholipase A-2-activating protein